MDDHDHDHKPDLLAAIHELHEAAREFGRRLDWFERKFDSFRGEMQDDFLAVRSRLYRIETKLPAPHRDEARYPAAEEKHP